MRLFHRLVLLAHTTDVESQVEVEYNWFTNHKDHYWLLKEGVLQKIRLISNSQTFLVEIGPPDSAVDLNFALLALREISQTFSIRVFDFPLLLINLHRLWFNIHF